MKTVRIKLSNTKIIRATLLCDLQDPNRFSGQKSHIAHCLVQNRAFAPSGLVVRLPDGQ